MSRQPTLFVSHGAPSFAAESGGMASRLAALGRLLPPADALLVVSPHWSTDSVVVSTAVRPETLHDYEGFGEELRLIRYPAPGAPGLAAQAVEVLCRAGWGARADAGRGLDHGAWVPLRHMLPSAGTPVFQVSMPSGLSAREAFLLGQALRPMRDRNVLVVGSGALTHNLVDMDLQSTVELGYAREFTEWVRHAIEAGDTTRLLDALESAPHARVAHSTPEHFLPLLVALGAAGDILPATLLTTPIRWAAIAMDSYVFGRRYEIPHP